MALPDVISPRRTRARPSISSVDQDRLNPLFTRVLQRGGVADPIVEAEPGIHPLADPEDWWTVVLGTGYRATIQQLDAAAAQRVRAANVQWLRQHEVHELQTNVIYALARKPDR
jgi:hypothetical protein